MEARVTSYSQSERLRERMVQAEVRHGQEIRADLPGIRVEAMGRNWFIGKPSRHGVVFFCTMGPITIRETTTPGDGGPLPSNVILEGLEIPAEGIYNLKDVLVQSNGDLRVIIDGASRVEPVARREETGQVSPMFV
ncbi:MAG TPA: hypothetical protein VKB22_07480 [Gemmatimonadales bacterium]|jgi:hypothetical protein|nr:hypothetical protein [Gemmatimonadales bacterium]